MTGKVEIAPVTLLSIGTNPAEPLQNFAQHARSVGLTVGTILRAATPMPVGNVGGAFSPSCCRRSADSWLSQYHARRKSLARRSLPVPTRNSGACPVFRARCYEMSTDP